MNSTKALVFLLYYIINIVLEEVPQFYEFNVAINKNQRLVHGLCVLNFGPNFGFEKFKSQIGFILKGFDIQRDEFHAEIILVFYQVLVVRFVLYASFIIMQIILF